MCSFQFAAPTFLIWSEVSPFFAVGYCCVLSAKPQVPLRGSVEAPWDGKRLNEVAMQLDAEISMQVHCTKRGKASGRWVFSAKPSSWPAKAPAKAGSQGPERLMTLSLSGESACERETAMILLFHRLTGANRNHDDDAGQGFVAAWSRPLPKLGKWLTIHF